MTNRHMLLRPKILKTKLSKWGYTKNIKRNEALEVLREKSNREAIGKDYEFTVRRRPVDLEKIQRHGKRAGFQHLQLDTLWNSQNPNRAVVCRTPPPALPTALPVFEPWRVAEKLLF